MAKKKKECKCKKKAKVEEQTAFFAFQSGTADKGAMDLVFECIGEMTIALKKKKIRLYSVYQSGVPHNPCGLPGYPKCQ